MGCAESKTELRTHPNAGSEGGGGGGSSTDIAGEERTKTFRERRLSISQMQDQNTRPRRLSVYGSATDNPGQPTEVRSPCSTCGCLTLGGFEPVPGGSIAKINQDRGIAIYPFRTVAKHVSQGPLTC